MIPPPFNILKIMNATFNEELSKATQGASLLSGDLRAAHSAACKAESTAGELALILLESAIAEARQLADKLKRIQDATERKDTGN